MKVRSADIHRVYAKVTVRSDIVPRLPLAMRARLYHTANADTRIAGWVTFYSLPKDFAGTVAREAERIMWFDAHGGEGSAAVQ